MKTVDNILYIEFADFIAAGWKEQAVKMANHRNGPYWQMIADPADRRKPLVQYDTLRQEHKDKLTSQFGNPYEYVAKAPIRTLVTKDIKAEEYFLAYRYQGNKTLPSEHVSKYSKAANWLNMIATWHEDIKSLRKELGITKEQFWKHVIDLIRSEQVDLPTSYQRLLNKVKEYNEKGYECLVDWRFGNKLAAKVEDETSLAMMLELLSHPAKHDDVVICMHYNQWATGSGYEPVTPQTVANYRRKFGYQITASRDGNAAWYNTYGKQIQRQRPTAPMLLWGSDDNDLDLYFIDESYKNGRKVTNHYVRMSLVVVMDAHNDYILGYAYGRTTNTELIRRAYLDAMYHVKELTGAWYLPHQLQTDRFGLDVSLKNDLAQFYQAIATYTPATAKAPRGKYIERAFGQQWHQNLKTYPNYAGHNVSAKTKLNRENLELVKRDFPSIEDAPAYIEDHINKMRCLVNPKTGASRQQIWLEKFNQDDRCRERLISDMKFLHTFGTRHQVASANNPMLPNTITNGGLRVTINGQQLTFDIPDELYLENVGKQVGVIYDPYNLDRVLVTDDKGLRFVAQQYQLMPAAIADYKPGDGERLHAALALKRNHVAAISQQKQDRKSLIATQRIDAESLLQAQVLVKHLKQAAEHNLLNSAPESKDWDALDLM
jgi:hypothetical protein